MKTAPTIAFLVAIVFVRNATADIIFNGNFEVPVQGPPNYATFNIPAGSTYISGWTVVQGNVDLTTTANYGPGTNTLDPNSVQDIDLIGDANGSGGVFGGLSQTFTTLAGQQYLLTFDYSHNPGTFSPDYAAQVTVADANAPGNIVLSAEISQPYGPAPWVAFAQTFTANSTSTVLTFIATRGASNAGIYLDDVSIVPVPEPGSTFLLLLGLFSVGLVAHRWPSRRSTAVR